MDMLVPIEVVRFWVLGIVGFSCSSTCLLIIGGLRGEKPRVRIWIIGVDLVLWDVGVVIDVG